MRSAYIIGGKRSYIGVKNGMYKHIPAEKLGAQVMKSVINSYSVVPEIAVCGNSVGAGGNISRLMCLTAGYDIPAVTIDTQCSSGLESISIASQKVMCGEYDVILAGGFESASTQPIRAYNPNHPNFKEGTYNTAQFVPESHSENIMIEGAEYTSDFFNITRFDTDKYVLKSHRLADLSREYLNDITVSVNGSTKDEGIRNMSEKLLARVKPILNNGKHITPANSTLINDGASFVLVVSERMLNKINAKSAFKISDCICVSGDAMLTPTLVTDGIGKILERNNLYESDIDNLEYNEAFALIDILVERKYTLLYKNSNIFGGAIAYGHPYGASGAIILLHLMKAMEKTGGNRGIASIAAAGGIGNAMLIERVSL